jgi:hypothetical protein
MHRWLFCGAVATVVGCSLLTNLDGLTSGSDGGDAASDVSAPVDATPDGADASFDASEDATLDAGTKHDAAPIMVLQHLPCHYVNSPDTFSCKFSVPSEEGNAFVVHFYFNYGDVRSIVNSLTDDNANTYTFAAIGEQNCPAGQLPGHSCCTAIGGHGTCQGWGFATNVKLATKNPATITFGLTNPPTPVVMGAEVFEVSGLADSPVDVAFAEPLDASADAEVNAPPLTTSLPGELVLVGIAFWEPSSARIAPSAGWVINEDTGFYSGGLYRIGGPAGSTYGDALGVVTGLTTPGTSTIMAMKPR